MTKNSALVTRTYKAPDMLSALEMVREDMGTEAIIVSARNSAQAPAWKVWQRSGVEVIAMQSSMDGGVDNGWEEHFSREAHRVQSKPMNEVKLRPFKEIKLADQEVVVKQSLALELEERKQQTVPELAEVELDIDTKWVGRKGEKEELEHTVEIETNVSDTQPSPILMPAVLDKFRQRLLSEGLDERLLEKIINVSKDILPTRILENERLVKAHLIKQLEASLKTDDGGILKEKQIVCVVGMSGSGKTSMIAKMTSYFTNIMKRKVAWVSADSFRAGAGAQAQALAESLGVNFHLAYTPEELVEFVEMESQADLIFVDTPSCNPKRRDEVKGLGTFLTVLPNRITYVVLPAVIKESDATRILTAFNIFNLNGLIFTKLDETTSYGSIFNLAWKRKLPMTYFSSGPSVMDDFSPANARELAEALFGEGLAK